MKGCVIAAAYIIDTIERNIFMLYTSVWIPNGGIVNELDWINAWDMYNVCTVHIVSDGYLNCVHCTHTYSNNHTIYKSHIYDTGGMKNVSWEKKVEILKPNFRIFVDKTEKSHGKQLGFLSAAINLRNFRDYENGFRLMRKKNTERNTTNENKTKKKLHAVK